MKTIIEKHGEVNYQEIPQNFIYPEIKETDYIFGSGDFVGEILRQDGDWRSYTPPMEFQRRNGIESSSCFVQGQQHAIATVLEEKYGEINDNYSERFNALLADGTPNGGSPLLAAESIKNDGLIPDSLLPFSDDIVSWEEFHSFKGQSESLCRLRGKEWRKLWKPIYEIVFMKDEQVERKYAKIVERLKCGPMPVSVSAWYEKDGIYVKPIGESDNHFVELVYVSPLGEPYIWDTYEPFLKKLDKWYNFDLGMIWTVNKLTPQNTGTWYNIFNFISNYLREIFK